MACSVTKGWNLLVPHVLAEWKSVGMTEVTNVLPF